MPHDPISKGPSDGPSREETPARRLFGDLYLLPVILAAASVAPALVDLIRSEDRLPFWDMAKYGVSGLRLHQAVQDLDLWRVPVEIHSMSVWPPVWPSVLAVAFPFGLEPTTPRYLMVGIWVAVLVAAAWAPGRLDLQVTADKPSGPASRQNLALGPVLGLLCAAWLLGSPFLRGFATLNMLELPGLLLLILCWGLYLRAVEQEPGAGHQRAWRLVAVTSTLLFFCKYNYGLFWWIPLILAEARRKAGSWRAVVAAGIHSATRIPWRHPLSILWMLMVPLSVWLGAGGGIDTEMLGLGLRMTSIGNPLYLSFVLSILQAARLVLKDRSLWTARFKALAPEHRILCVWCLAPTVGWFLLPPHLKELAGFLGNRSSDLGFWHGLLFYPRILVESYVAEPRLAVAALILAPWILLDLRSTDPKRRITALLFLVTTVALLRHPYKLDRFAVQWFWLVGLAAARTLLVAIAKLDVAWGSQKPVDGRRPVVAVTSAAVSLGALLWAAMLPTGPSVRDLHRLHTVEPEARPLLDQLVRWGREGDVLVLGTWNGLSPALIEWHVAAAMAKDGHDASAAVTSGFELARRDPQGLKQALAAQNFDTVVVLRPSREPFRAVAAAENAWLQPVVDELLAAPTRHHVETPDALGGYELRVLRRRPPLSSQPES